MTPAPYSFSPSTQASDPSLPTPSYYAGARGVMLLTPAKSRQPPQAAWSREQLIHERAIALGYALDNSTLQTYNSHLQSYFSFCKLHSLRWTLPRYPLILHRLHVAPHQTGLSNAVSLRNH